MHNKNKDLLATHAKYVLIMYNKDKHSVHMLINVC